VALGARLLVERRAALRLFHGVDPVPDRLYLTRRDLWAGNADDQDRDDRTRPDTGALDLIPISLTVQRGSASHRPDRLAPPR